MGLRHRFLGARVLLGAYASAMGHVGESPSCGVAQHLLDMQSGGKHPALCLRLVAQRFRHHPRTDDILLHLHLEPQHQGGVATGATGPAPRHRCPARRVRGDDGQRWGGICGLVSPQRGCAASLAPMGIGRTGGVHAALHLPMALQLSPA